MKLTRILLTSIGAIVLTALTPACEMHSASTTVPGYAEKQKAESTLATQPAVSNPNAPKYFQE